SSYSFFVRPLLGFTASPCFTSFARGLSGPFGPGSVPASPGTRHLQLQLTFITYGLAFFLLSLPAIVFLSVSVFGFTSRPPFRQTLAPLHVPLPQRSSHLLIIACLQAPSLS